MCIFGLEKNNNCGHLRVVLESCVHRRPDGTCKDQLSPMVSSTTEDCAICAAKFADMGNEPDEEEERNQAQLRIFFRELNRLLLRYVPDPSDPFFSFMHTD